MKLFVLAATLAGLVLAAAPAFADPRAELAQVRHDLAVGEQVLARIADRVRTARADPATGDAQRVLLDEYLAHVRDLVAASRDRVRVLEQQVAALPAGTPVAAASSGAARTEAEEIAALDARLGDSLSTFDQLLLDEARKARIRERREGGAGASGGTGGSDAGGARGSRGAKGETGGPGTDRPGGEPGAEGTADGGKDAPQGPADGSPGGRVRGDRPGASGGGTAATPPDVGNGNDDDIVARQIRRAAESEPDPELRKKLWDEYRKYKQGAATKG
jgi:hypothetical protein